MANIDIKHYDVVVKPVITEKSTLVSEYNQVVFQVAKDSTKPQIKAAIEALYGVKVLAVNTMVAKGKTKRWRGQEYRLSLIHIRRCRRKERCIIRAAPAHVKKQPTACQSDI